MADPLFVHDSTAEEVRRLRREADAYDALLMRRLEDRGEPPADLYLEAELPGEDEVLLDTALYHATSERTARARALVRRERAVAALCVLATVAAGAAGRRALASMRNR